MKRKPKEAAGTLNHRPSKNGKTVATPYSRKGWDKAANRIEKNLEHLEAMETKAPKKGSVQITLPKLDIRNIIFTIVGDAPLLCHKWSEKAIKQMLDKQMGVASAGKEPKDPQQDYEDSLYNLPGGGYGFPAIAFKNAAVSACTSVGKSVTKVQARQAFHVVGKLLPIKGKPQMREDAVRIGQGTADLRYRGEFLEWSIQLHVRYNHNLLTADQVVNLFNIAGFAVGVGEYRCERDGDCGYFHVVIKAPPAQKRTG